MIGYRSRQRPRGEASLDTAMTPMIDVVFLLLVFFVCTASFRLIEQMLPGTLSAPAAGNTETTESPPDPEADFERVVIRISWDGSQPAWTVNDQAVADPAELRQVLDSLAGIKPDAKLILHPAAEVPLGWVIRAWDWSRLAGFQSIAFAVNQKQP